MTEKILEKIEEHTKTTAKAADLIKDKLTTFEIELKRSRESNEEINRLDRELREKHFGGLKEQAVKLVTCLEVLPSLNRKIVWLLLIITFAVGASLFLFQTPIAKLLFP